jgi:hypothetical protein
MIINNLMKDMAFSDPVRSLQRTSSNAPENAAGPEERDFNVTGIYIVGFVTLVIVVVAGFRMVQKSFFRESGNVVDASEFPEDKAVEREAKSTLAKRKQAILELFKTAQVTMVSNIHTVIRISNFRK